MERQLWTDEEISILVPACGRAPDKSPRGCAARTQPSATRQNSCEKGLLEGRPRGRSNNPDLQDFDEVKMDYCRKHNITIAQLCARLEDDDQLMAELYRLALAAKLIRLHPLGTITARLTWDRRRFTAADQQSGRAARCAVSAGSRRDRSTFSGRTGVENEPQIAVTHALDHRRTGLHQPG